MKKLFRKSIYITMLGLCMVLGSCEDFLDINTDPNNPSADKADLNLLLPSIEGSIVSAFTNDAHTVASLLMRYTYDQSVTRYNISTNTTITSWDDIYLMALPDINLYIQLAEEQELPGYAGVGKILKAYLYSMTVDIYGEAPFTNGTKFTEDLNPVFDDGLTVYKGVFGLIDSGLADLNTTGTVAMPATTSDFFFAGNKAKWIRAANSLKMKLLIQVKDVNDSELQQRVSTELPQILADQSYITATADDWQFKFGTSNNPENRHPFYVADYTTDAGYKQLFFINYLVENNDPRLHYYFVRQTTADPSGNATPCESRDCNNYYIGGGWIARDHGDSEGVPADGKARVAYGVYPAGGKFTPFDDGVTPAEITPAAEGQGMAGAGIFPVITAFYLKFLAAEAALTIPGAGGDAAQLLEEGIRLNIAKVIAFGASAPGYAALKDDFEPTEEEIDAYVQDVMDAYDAAASDEERLDIIMFEMWKANFGNALETYNTYRRTGYPSILQTAAPSLDEVNQFTLRALYSTNEIAANKSLTTIPHSRVPVFWDVDPDDTNDIFN